MRYVRLGESLVHDYPSTVGLAACMAARFFGTTAHIDGLAIGRAAKSIGIVVILADIEGAIIARVRITPIIGLIGTFSAKPFVIGIVGV